MQPIYNWFNFTATDTQIKMKSQATFNCLNNALVMYLINADIKQINVLLTNSNVRFGFTEWHKDKSGQNKDQMLANFVSVIVVPTGDEGHVVNLVMCTNRD